MTDEPNDTPIDVQPMKKPYVKPQLHVLSGHDAEGKRNYPDEMVYLGGGYGPS